LAQNFPNPFNPSTTIGFGLPVRGKVKIRVFNILGQLVAELGGADLEAGYHQVVWDGKANDGVAVGSGVYFYQLVVTPANLQRPGAQSGSSSSVMAVRKMLLLK
jgi:flagellar hook assembly protein FlgD